MTDKPNPFSVRKVAKVRDAVQETKASKPSANFGADDLVGMTFNMPRSWHRDFKGTAVVEGITMHELLLRSFDAYKKAND